MFKFNGVSGAEILAKKTTETNTTGMCVGRLPKNIVIPVITRDVPAVRLINALQKSAFLQIITVEAEETAVFHVPERPLVVLPPECPLITDTEFSDMSYNTMVNHR